MKMSEENIDDVFDFFMEDNDEDEPDVFGSFLDEKEEDITISGDTTFLSDFGDSSFSFDSEDDELDDKYIASVEYFRENILISLAQYMRLFKKEQIVNSLSTSLKGLKYIGTGDSIHAKLIPIFLQNIEHLIDTANVDKVSNLFRAWYFSEDDIIVSDFSEVVLNKLKTLSLVRDKILGTDENRLETEFIKFDRELISQLQGKKDLDSRYDKKQDPELSALINEMDECIVMSNNIHNEDAEKKMGSKYGINLTIIASGDMIKDLSDNKIYSTYSFPTKIQMSVSNKMVFKCQCGAVNDASTAITFIRDKGGNYQRVRPVNCKQCGKKLILNQVLLFRFATSLFENSNGLEGKAVEKSVFTLGIDALSSISIKEDENPSAQHVRRIIKSIGTDMLPDYNIKVINSQEMISSYQNYIDTLLIKESVKVDDNSVLGMYLLHMNDIPMDTKSMVNFVYNKMNSKTYEKVAITAKHNSSITNTNRLKTTLLGIAENPIFTKEIFSPTFMTKTFLNKKEKYVEEESIDFISTRKEILEIINRGPATVSEYQKLCDSADDETLFYSMVGQMIEKLLVDDTYRETIFESLLYLFVKDVTESAMPTVVIKIPYKTVIVGNDKKELRKLVTGKEELTVHAFYKKLSKDCNEFIYPAFKLFKQLDTSNFTNFKPTNTLYLEGGITYHFRLLQLLSNFEEIKSMYLGIVDEQENPWENQLARTLFLKALINTFPISRWADEDLYMQLQIYLDIKYREWAV